MSERTMPNSNPIDRDAVADPDSGGQSGDTQGLPSAADVADESVEDLVEEGQDYEAEVVEGVEDAGDHPEEPLRPRDEAGRMSRR